VTSVVIAVALAGLALVSCTAVLSMIRANDRVTATREVVTSYLDLQGAVAGEAFAEAGYRRAPSPAARVRLDGAIDAVDVAVQEVRTIADRRDSATLSRLELLNDRYVAEVRATLDDTRVTTRDDRVAGPALDAMQTLLESAVSGHRTEAMRSIDRQEVVVDRLTVVLPTAFLLAFVVLGWTWRMLLLDHRRLRVEAAASATHARTDALTGLPNRSSLREVMDDAFDRPRTQAALLFMDLDRFKPVNDSLGHHAGDLVLQEVARRLLETVRAGEVAARIGGDEFAVFLPRGLAAPAVATRILGAIEQPFVVEGHEVRIGTSIGVARYPEDGHDYATLLKVADAALYEAKQAGRGRVAESSRPAAGTGAALPA
jgi:diguanylate cyclase (GGDEF)-like protein